MGDKRDINFQSTERQKRILPEDSFGDWKWREALAELMVPLIGSLYRKGINIQYQFSRMKKVYETMN